MNGPLVEAPEQVHHDSSAARIDNGLQGAFAISSSRQCKTILQTPYIPVPPAVASRKLACNASEQLFEILAVARVNVAFAWGSVLATQAPSHPRNASFLGAGVKGLIAALETQFGIGAY